MVHRWRDDLLQYQFIICQQPERMMWECDILSQYNKATELWRESDVENAFTEVSLVAHLEVADERADHKPMVLFTK